MAPLELRYAILKGLHAQAIHAEMIPPVAGKTALKLKVKMSDPYGQERIYTVTIEGEIDAAAPDGEDACDPAARIGFSPAAYMSACAL